MTLTSSDRNIYKSCCSYTLFSEICDEKGRKLNYISGWVFWVVGMVLVPFMGQ